jgi:hypothetical protein
VLDFTWQVVAGEESKESEVENQREMRVLEAVYPRPSAIPPKYDTCSFLEKILHLAYTLPCTEQLFSSLYSPSVLADAEDSSHNDEQAFLIPLTPIEDEDVAVDISFDSMAPFPVSLSQQPLPLAAGIRYPSQCSLPSISNPPAQAPTGGMVVGAEPDVAASASAAFNAIVEGNEHGSLIDHELLIKILSNPKMIEKLVTDYGPAAANTQDVPKPRSPPASSSDQPPVHIDRTLSSTPPSATLLAGPFFHQPNGVGAGPPNLRLPPPPAIPVSSPSLVGAPPAKDISYYKSLIQQHGEERQDAPPQYGNNRQSHQSGANQELVNNHRSRDVRPKIMKPCIYFNSSRGCRHGANCSYQHDASFQQRGTSVQEMQSAKRMKVDREISN